MEVRNEFAKKSPNQRIKKNRVMYGREKRYTGATSKSTLPL